MRNQGFEFVFFRKNSVKDPDTSSEKIKSAIRNNPSITSDEMAKSIGKSRRTIQNVLNELKAEGWIERIGSNKTGYWKLNEKE